jgi:hypothetical protein
MVVFTELLTRTDQEAEAPGLVSALLVAAAAAAAAAAAVVVAAVAAVAVVR